MDSETRQLRALEAEVAALQRECRMLQNPGEKASGAWYVARVHPSCPCTLAHGGLINLLTVLGSDSPRNPVLNNIVGDVLKCGLESVFCEDDDLRVWTLRLGLMA